MGFLKMLLKYKSVKYRVMKNGERVETGKIRMKDPGRNKTSFEWKKQHLEKARVKTRAKF